MRFPKLGSLRRRSIDTPEEKRDDGAFSKTKGSLEVPDVVPSPRSTDTDDINQTGLAAWKDPTNFAAEFDRLSLLHSLSVKTPSEQRFDAITNLIQSIFQTPIALVSLSYEDEQWCKSIAGPSDARSKSQEKNLRKHSCCDKIHISDNPEVLVVEDLLSDARFSESPYIKGPPYLRFYAGSPLVGSTGYRYGTLCIMDVKPRSFPSNLLSVLVNFAEITTRELESGSFDTSLKLKRLGELAQRSKSDYEEPIALLDLDVKGWPVLYSNSYWEDQVDGGGDGKGVNNGGERTSTSSNRSSQDANSFWNIFKCLDPVEISRDVPAALQSRHPIKLKVQLKKKIDGVCNDQHDLRVLLRPASDTLAKKIPVGIPGFVPFDVDIAGHENGNLWFATLHIASSPRTSNGGRIITSTITATNHPISTGTTNPYRSTPSGSTTPSDRSSTKRGSFESQVETPKGVVEARLKQPFATSFKNQQASIVEEEEKAKPAPSGLVTIAPKALLPYQMALPERYSDLHVGPLLGSGRYARVHRAVWRGSIVAVKLIEFPADASNWEDIERSVIEAVQPDVSNAYSTAGGGHWAAPTAPLQEVDCVWLIQELCTGGTLGDALDRGWLKIRRSPDAPIDLVKYLLTAADIISAVGFLHSRGITHGNLNYNNVLLTAPHTPRDDGIGGAGSSKPDTRGFIAKLADFGLARVAQNDDSTSTRHYGDVSHQPPEILSDGILTLSTDIYSFGTLLWEMYTGVRAWRGQHQDAVIQAVCAGRGLKCLPENDTHAPEALKNLVARCLDMDRKKRPTAVEAWNEVQAMLAENIEASAG